MKKMEKCDHRGFAGSKTIRFFTTFTPYISESNRYDIDTIFLRVFNYNYVSNLCVKFSSDNSTESGSTRKWVKSKRHCCQISDFSNQSAIFNAFCYNIYDLVLSEI